MDDTNQNVENSCKSDTISSVKFKSRVRFESIQIVSAFSFFAIFCFPTLFFNHTPEAEVLIQRQDEIQTDEISCFNCSKR